MNKYDFSVRILTTTNEFTAYDSPRGVEHRYTLPDGTTSSGFGCFATKYFPDGGYGTNLKYIYAHDFKEIVIIGELDKDATYSVYKTDGYNLDFTSLECVYSNENTFTLPEEVGRYFVRFSVSFKTKTEEKEDVTTDYIYTNIYYFGIVIFPNS